MKVLHEIKMDLVRHTKPTIHVVQGDAFSRTVKVTLFSNKRPWYIPREASVLIRYKKSNRECGVYDTLPDGSKAFLINGNSVTIVITPDVFSHSGQVSVIVSLVVDEIELSTFELLFYVQSNFSSEAHGTDNATSVTGMLPTPDQAQAGQFLIVKEVNERGKVKKTEAVDMDSDRVTPFIAAYLDENPPEPGKDGKSAYEYAKEGGYTGTEAEFAAKLAAGSMTVSLYNCVDDGFFDADHTPEECVKAFSNGVAIYVNATYENREYAGPVCTVIQEEDDSGVVAAILFNIDNVADTMSVLGYSGEGWFWGAPPVTYAALGDIPTALKNPNALTINGTTYDGSGAVDFTNVINTMIDAKLGVIENGAY